MYLCVYVSTSLSSGWMIAYTRKWHEEILGLMENKLGKVVMKNIWGQYHVVMSWYHVIILCLCYG